MREKRDTYITKISVSETFALRDARLAYTLAYQGRWEELREMFTPEDPEIGDGGYSEGQMRILDDLVDRFQEQSDATPWTVETRAQIARIRAERGR